MPTDAQRVTGYDVDAPGAAAAIGRALLALTEAEHAAVFFRSPNGVLTCPWSHNLSDAYVRELVTPDGVNSWMHILRYPELTCMDLPKTRRRTSTAPWLLRDVRELSSDHARLIDRATREGLRSMCAWPLGQEGRVIGAVTYYYDAPHVCSTPELEIMHAFALQAATAIENGIAPRTRTPQGSGSAGYQWVDGNL